MIQLAYAIGVSKPLSIYVDLFDNDENKNRHVEKLINENFEIISYEDITDNILLALDKMSEKRKKQIKYFK